MFQGEGVCEFGCSTLAVSAATRVRLLAAQAAFEWMGWGSGSWGWGCLCVAWCF